MWDDHDYGVNNGGKRFVRKHLVREVFLDFLGEPRDSDRYLDKDSPIHQDYIITTPDQVKVHLVLLDVRYDFDPVTKDRLGEK